MNTPILASRRTSSICLACRRSLLRPFSSSRSSWASFQAYPLASPAPPRNTPGAENPITHTVQAPLPKVHETRPPAQLAGKEASSAAAASWQTSARTAMEQRQSPAPTRSADPITSAPLATPEQASSTPTVATTTTPATKARPRSKLRTPRKAAMKLTPSAVAHLQELLDQPEPQLIKVGVRNRGCSGLAYHLEFVDKPGAFDETVEQDGVRVLIDSKALFSIIGSEMDWVEDKLSQRFVFRNPNIKEECGCGESFMV